MSETNELILVAVGPDQVGLVQALSEFIANHGGSIEDSRMAVLSGEFAFMALISGESRSLVNISRESMDLGTRTGLNIWVKLPSGKKAVEPSLPYKLTASCMDHPGVVYKISSTLSAVGVNIESMDTQTYEAPVSGTPIFKMEALLTVPARLNVNQLRDSLSAIEREENIDLELALMSGE